MKKSRKTKADRKAEHDLFLELLNERKPTLEIMTKLGLTMVQFKGHVHDALVNSEVAPEGLIPEYELVHLEALPRAIQKMVSAPTGNENVLIKVASCTQGVLLTVFQSATDVDCLTNPHEVNGPHGAAAVQPLNI